jgi:26S proteasome regulatory subunit N13
MLSQANSTTCPFEVLRLVRRTITDMDQSAAAGNMDASSIIQNFIKSMGGQQSGSGRQGGAQEKLFTTLQDLLTTNSTISYLESIDEQEADRLLRYLPPQLITLAKTADEGPEGGDLSFGQKKAILARVLRSPQFTQSNSSLTIALRDGGLPSIADALGVSVQNRGFMRGGAMPLGGGEAVEAFVEGIKDQVQKEQGQKSHGGDDSMETQ